MTNVWWNPFSCTQEICSLLFWYTICLLSTLCCTNTRTQWVMSMQHYALMEFLFGNSSSPGTSLRVDPIGHAAINELSYFVASIIIVIIQIKIMIIIVGRILMQTTDTISTFINESLSQRWLWRNTSNVGRVDFCNLQIRFWCNRLLK